MRFLIKQETMKILTTVQKNFALIGISAKQSTQNNPFNAENLIVLLILCLTLITNVMNLIYEADNFKDYTISVFSCSTMIVAILIFVMILARMRHLFDFLKQAEQIINKSKK